MTVRASTCVAWDARWWDRQGTFAGLAAGIAVLAVGAAWALVTAGDLGVIWPLRLGVSLLLGPAALDAETPLGPPTVTGGLVHLLFSAAFGILFGALLARCGSLWCSLNVLVCPGGLYGIVLWLVNVSAIAPTSGWSWVPESVGPIDYLIVHTFGYSVPLALYLSWATTPRRPLGLH